MRSILILALAASLCMAESKPKRKTSDEEAGVQAAIAYQRAKDRADARQARLEKRHPERFSYAAPQNHGPNSLANEQRRQALEHRQKQ